MIVGYLIWLELVMSTLPAKLGTLHYILLHFVEEIVQSLGNVFIREGNLDWYVDKL